MRETVCKDKRKRMKRRKRETKKTFIFTNLNEVARLRRLNSHKNRSFTYEMFTFEARKSQIETWGGKSAVCCIKLKNAHFIGSLSVLNHNIILHESQHDLSYITT